MSLNNTQFNPRLKCQRLQKRAWTQTTYAAISLLNIMENLKGDKDLNFTPRCAAGRASASAALAKRSLSP